MVALVAAIGAQYLTPLSHTVSLPSARTARLRPVCLALLRTLLRGVSLVINPKPGQFIQVYCRFHLVCPEKKFGVRKFSMLGTN